MSYNGSGTYVPPAGQPVTTGTVIQSATFNTLVTDIGNTFNNVLPRDGQAAMQGQLKLIDGTSSVPGIAFNGEASSGMFRPGSGTLALTASGIEGLRINSAGRVMIGTTTDDGTSKLQVNGGILQNGATVARLGDNGTVLRSQNASSSNADQFYIKHLSANTEIGNTRGALSLKGNADTATALATSRSINGVGFNGTADITVLDSTKLPTAGGTLTGTLFGAAGVTQAGVTGLNPSTAPFVTALASVDPATPSFTPALHTRTQLNGYGYVQQISIGSYRPGAGATWGGGAYVAVGGNDAYPTESFLLKYGGDITHSSGSTFLNTNNLTTYTGAKTNPIFLGQMSLNSNASSWVNGASVYSAGNYTAFGQARGGTCDAVMSWNAPVSSGAASGAGYTYRNTGDIASAYEQNGNHRWYVSNTAGTAGSPIAFNLGMTLNARGDLAVGDYPRGNSSGFRFIENSTSTWMNQISNGNTYFGNNWYYLGGSYRYKTGGTAYLYVQDGGGHSWHTAPSGTADAAIAWTQQMTLNNNGQLLINTAASGSAKVQVGGMVAAGAFSSQAVSTQAPGVINSGNGTSQGSAVQLYSDGSSAYGINVNQSLGGLDICANQAGTETRFYGGTANSSPNLWGKFSNSGFYAGNVFAGGTLQAGGAIGSYSGYSSSATINYTGSSTQYGLTLKPTTSTTDTCAISFLTSSSTYGAANNVGSIIQRAGDAGLVLSGSWSVNGNPIAGTNQPTLSKPTIKGYVEQFQALNPGAAVTLNPDNGTLIELNVTANTTVTLPASAAGQSYTLIAYYTGAFSLTFAGGTSIRWAGGTAPATTSVSGRMDKYVFICGSNYTLAQDGGRNF